MIRTIKTVSCLLITALANPSMASDLQTSLTIFNWQYYLSDNAIQQWQEESQITIEQIYFDSDTHRDRTINQVNNGSIDITILDEVSARNFSSNDKLYRLKDHPQITNQKHIPLNWRKQCGEYGIPYFWGTLGIVYRKDLFPESPTSWKQLLEPTTEHYGKVVMTNDYTDLLLPSLFILDSSIENAGRSELGKVYHQLLKQVPHVQTYDYIISYLEADPERAKGVHLGIAYSGDEATLNSLNNDYEWGYVVPKEGTILWVDCLAVLKKSLKPDDAFAFINFLHRPEVAALNAIDIGNSTTNLQAIKIINQSRPKVRELTPSDDLIKHAQFYSTQGNTSIILRSRISNAIIQQHKVLNNND
ncbi:spermidine/putrescine ABC transporter substrate-binding protein [Vibrio makurazakiensis]|uniref:polyamine ABC transporter substrate-binding protein n=1 Tax=Vibrio makurazakiensis TaxID=2910250 RepID=UPI003D12FB58